MDPISIANIGSGLIKAGVGYFQDRKANKLLNNLQYPNQSIPSAIKENKAQAELDANIGMPSEQYNLAMKNFQRNQLAGLRSGADRNAGVGLITALNDNMNTATGNLDAKSAEIRMQNKRNLQGVNNVYGNWQDRVWQNNIKDKYNRDYNYGMSLKGMGQQNMLAGLDSGLAGGLGMIGSGGFGGAGKKKSNSNSLYEEDLIHG